MPLPPGVTTCTYIAGPAGSFFGTQARVSVLIRADYGGPNRLIYQPTGFVMGAFEETVPEDADGIVQFDLPHVDQAGFRDPAGNDVTFWKYVVTVTVATVGSTRRTISYTQELQPTVGQDNVDLDLVPDGSASELPTTNLPPATSLAVVSHGANPNIARPNATAVWWVGTVDPANRTPADIVTGPEQ